MLLSTDVIFIVLFLQVCGAMAVCMKENYKGLEKTIDDCAMCGQIAAIQKALIKGEDNGIDRTNFLLSVCDGVNDNQAEEVSLQKM